jgi:hypothetical protein
VKSQQSFGFAGPLASVDRRKTGPFGRAFAAGGAPGPGQYLSQDYGSSPRPQSSVPTSFGLADRSTFAKVSLSVCFPGAYPDFCSGTSGSRPQKQCDPFVKPQLDPLATPGPGQYKMEDEERIQALDASLKSANTKSPGTVGTHFTFASTSSSRIKYASSRVVRTCSKRAYDVVRCFGHYIEDFAENASGGHDRLDRGQVHYRTVRQV